jgi:hypothetical protein
MYSVACVLCTFCRFLGVFVTSIKTSLLKDFLMTNIPESYDSLEYCAPAGFFL